MIKKIKQNYKHILLVCIIFLFFFGLSNISVYMFTKVNTSEHVRYFYDLGELVEFVNEDKTNEIEYSLLFDCDKFAFELQKNAFKLGYIVNMQSITPEEYKEYFGVDINGYHMICSTVAGNSFYYIDAQNDIIRRVAYMGVI